MEKETLSKDDPGAAPDSLDERTSPHRLPILLVVSAIVLLVTGLADLEANPPPAQSDEVSNGKTEWGAQLIAPVGANADGGLDQKNGNLGFADSRAAIPFVFSRSQTDRERARECLATAAWFEAGNDVAGQKAVIQVVLNRLRHPAFPKTVCGVVFQGSEQPTGCQFTFTCDGSRMRRQPNKTAWRQVQALAENALAGATEQAVGSATHYHADYVNPWWSAQLQPVSSVGAHIFYVWRSSAGQLLPNPLATGIEPTLLADWVRRSVSSPVQDSSGQEEADLVLADQEVPAHASSTRIAEALPARQAIFMTLDGPEASGRWAVNAMDRCLGKTSCVVIGYANTELIDRNQGRFGASMDRPAFLFVRDDASGMDVALWDCKKTMRNDSSQCLPEAGPALTRLMRER